MTNGRRMSPVPQLKCVGGTAGCKAFTPQVEIICLKLNLILYPDIFLWLYCCFVQVVQCYNRGWDGEDVQWECKSDMDNAFRFGQISVNCEGFSYAEDPYVLKGSCGVIFSNCIHHTT